MVAAVIMSLVGAAPGPRPAPRCLLRGRGRRGIRRSLGQSYLGAPAWSQGDLNSVSCATAAFCVATEGFHTGNAIQYDGLDWTPEGPIDPSGFMVGVSCPTDKLCEGIYKFISTMAIASGITLKAFTLSSYGLTARMGCSGSLSVSLSTTKQ